MKTLTDKLLSVFNKHKDTIQYKEWNGSMIAEATFFRSFQFDKKLYHFEIRVSRTIDNNPSVTVFFPGKQEFTIIDWGTRNRMSGFTVYKLIDCVNNYFLDEEKLVQIKNAMLENLPSWEELIDKRRKTLEEIFSQNNW
jgi:hypothetical protein